MAIEHGPKGGKIDRIFSEELANSDAVLWTVDPKRGGDHMLGTQRSDLDRGCRAVDFNLDLDRLGETLRIEIIRYRQELDRPSFDDNALLSKFRVSGFPEIGEYGLQAPETGTRLARQVVYGDQYVQIIGQRGLDVVECGDGTADGVCLDCTVRNHSIDHLKRTLHPRHWPIRSSAQIKIKGVLPHKSVSLHRAGNSVRSAA